MRFLVIIFISLHAFARVEVENLCLKYSLIFLEESSIERANAVEKIKKIISTQNAYCPGSVESVIFAKNHNEKAKLSLYSQMVENSLLNLEIISGQVWSEQEFKKNSAETRKLILKIEDPQKKAKFLNWLEETIKVENKKRLQTQRNIYKDCSPAAVDWSRMPSNKLQVSKSDGVGWCYAYAASQLMGYELGKSVSAPDVALTFNRKFLQDKKFKYAMPGNMSLTDSYIKLLTDLQNANSSEKITAEQMKRLLSYPTPDLSIEGGFISKAIEESVNKGICLDKDFKSNYAEEGETPVFGFLQKLQAIGDLSRVNCSRTLSDRVISRFPGLNLQDFAEIFNNSNQSGDIVDLLRDRSCKRQKVNFNVKNLECEQTTSYGGSDPKCTKKIYDTLIETLNKGKPVGISFMMKAFNKDDGTPPNHAVVVLQKKYDPIRKECLFKVRDSNMANDYWVGEGQLMSRTFGATYIE